MLETLKAGLQSLNPKKLNKTSTGQPIDPSIAQLRHLKTLDPLKQDTVSFGGKGKLIKAAKDAAQEAVTETISSSRKKLNTRDFSISNQVARALNEKAQGDHSELRSILMKTFSDITPNVGDTCSKHRPVFAVQSRVKSPVSIREKATGKMLKTKKEAAEQIKDLIGGRIVLGDGMQGGGALVIDKFIELAKSGKVKIVEIKSHFPPLTDYEYAPQSKLAQLAEASSARFGIDVPNKAVKNQSGYTAIHLGLEFPDGLSGEIQILGKDVLGLKEIEDIPYKVMSEKNVDGKYSEIKKIFEPLKPVSDIETDPENIRRAALRDAYTEYTAAAYRYEREKLPSKVREAKSQGKAPNFLSLQDHVARTGRGEDLPPELDFNNLNKLKIAAEK